MKKLLAMIVVVMLLFSLAACGIGGTSDPTESNNPDPSGNDNSRVSQNGDNNNGDKENNGDDENQGGNESAQPDASVSTTGTPVG